MDRGDVPVARLVPVESVGLARRPMASARLVPATFADKMTERQ